MTTVDCVGYHACASSSAMAEGDRIGYLVMRMRLEGSYCAGWVATLEAERFVLSSVAGAP